jgi:DNA-binding IclR family transcriptional regulator
LAAVQLLTKKPRTCLELADLLGVSRQTTHRYVSLMVAEGLIEQTGTRRQARSGPAAALYSWVPLEASC